MFSTKINKNKNFPLKKMQFVGDDKSLSPSQDYDHLLLPHTFQPLSKDMDPTIK